jgi:hypothetical protein
MQDRARRFVSVKPDRAILQVHTAGAGVRLQGWPSIQTEAGAERVEMTQNRQPILATPCLAAACSELVPYQCMPAGAVGSTAVNNIVIAQH